MWFLALLFSISPEAQASSFLKPLFTQLRPHETATFETLSGFHFELKAPQLCDESNAQKPSDLNATKILCRYEKAGEYRVRLSVCDNAKTFCKPESFVFRVGNGEARARRFAPSAALTQMQEELKKKTLPGFEHTQPDEILKSSDKKPVFVLVGTDWCPPCNEAKEALLSTDAFQAATFDWRRVYVDGDSESDSLAWKTHLPFFAYPTFALLTPDLKEVARYGGAFRLHDFEDWADEARKNLNVPIGELKDVVTKRKTGDFKQKLSDWLHWCDTKKDQDRLIEWAIVDENKPVLALFKESDIPKKALGDWIRIEITNHSQAAADEQMLWKLRLLEANKNSESFTSDLQALCEENTRVCKPWIEHLQKRAQFWESQKFSNAAEKDVALIEDYANQTDIYNAVEDKEKAKAAAEVCVKAADDLKKNSPLSHSRAAAIGASYCLGEVGRVTEAEKIYRELMADYGSEPTFFIRYANFLKKQKRLKEAKATIEKAMATAYGYNWMKAALLKAKIEMAQDDFSAANKTIHSSLAELNLSSSDPESRDRKLAKLFQELGAEMHNLKK
jgi:thioredoxin-like negative regulator of GroEL